MMSWSSKRWRVGEKIKLNVYEGDRPVCQCHNEEDALAIVEAMNISSGKIFVGVSDVVPSGDSVG